MVLVVAVEAVRAAVLLAVPVPFVFLSPVLRSHFQEGHHLASAAVRTSQQSLQVALGDRIGQVVVRELRWGQVLVVSVEARDEESGAPWGHSNVRHNFGYRGPLPLFSGVCWHLLKRKRRGGGSHQVLALAPLAMADFNTKILWDLLYVLILKDSLSCTCSCVRFIPGVLAYLHSLLVHPRVHPSAGFWSVAVKTARRQLFFTKFFVSYLTMYHI